MISMPVYVNSRSVGMVYVSRITNTEEPGPDDQVNQYQCEVFSHGSDASEYGEMSGTKHTFFVNHRYGDGVWVLLSKVLQAYHEQRAAPE